MFNPKLDVKLINLVKNNPVLYDYSHSKYMDFNAREVAWQRIGDELKRPAADCKVRWINIRDVNRRILKKSITQTRSQNRMYKYELEMAFMKPYYKDIAVPDNEYAGEDKSLWEDCDELPEPANDSEDMEKPLAKHKKGYKKRKKKKYEEQVEKSTNLLNDTANTSEFDPADPVDAFLLSIGATLKTFSPYHLNLAKSKIFAVVQEHDLQQIVQKSNEVKVPAPDTIFME